MNSEPVPGEQVQTADALKTNALNSDLTSRPTKGDAPALSESAIVAGALFDFMGMLTSQDEETHFSAHHDASPAVDMLRRFAAKRNFSLEPCDVLSWHKALAAREARVDPNERAIEAALSSPVACGESVRWYLEQAFPNDDEQTRSIMVREIVREILTHREAVSGEQPSNGKEVLPSGDAR